MTRADDKKRENHHRMAETLDRLEAEIAATVARGAMIPAAWHQIAQGGGRRAKVKMTLWVEAEVLAFFRAMGVGHTSRMADVLKAFMHARLAGMVKGPEDVRYAGVSEPMDGLDRTLADVMEAVRREVG